MYIVAPASVPAKPDTASLTFSHSVTGYSFSVLFAQYSYRDTSLVQTGTVLP